MKDLKYATGVYNERQHARLIIVIIVTCNLSRSVHGLKVCQRLPDSMLSSNQLM